MLWEKSNPSHPLRSCGYVSLATLQRQALTIDIICDSDRREQCCWPWFDIELYKSNIWIISHHARYAHAHRTLSLTLHARVIDKQNSNEKSRVKIKCLSMSKAKWTTLTEWSASVAEWWWDIDNHCGSDYLSKSQSLTSHNLSVSMQLPCAMFRAQPPTMHDKAPKTPLRGVRAAGTRKLWGIRSARS